MSAAEEGRVAGSRLGPYEIVSRLGAGGMGEVYRARDSRLAREIALKVLSEHFTTDRQRLQRFEREARVVSALNHPNIVTVFEIGQSDSVPFIAMELVDGQSLRQMLRSGGLPLRKLLDLATQIAEGLARAHEAGVVHRDLKPDNIMVTPDGGVKVLDFGLAKLTRSFLERGAAPDDGTLPLPTEPGVLIGTVRYMAPEQASGQSADYRSDQFSFGSVLYEMATGEAAFQRANTVDTLSAILHEEPRPLAQAAPKVPTPLRWIIERCLAKDPAERYAATRDLAHDLAALRAHLSEISGAGESGVIHRRNRRWPWWTSATLAAVLAGALLFWNPLRGREGASRSPVFRQLTFRAGMVGPARFSPDGQSIVYSAAWQNRPLEIFVQKPGQPEARPFGIQGASLLSISPSGITALSLGTRLAEPWIETGTLASTDMASSGGPRQLLENVNWADWGPGGELAIVRERQGRSTLEYPVGKILFQESAGFLSHLRFSRDGKLIAFLDHPVRSDDGGRVVVIDRSGAQQLATERLDTAWGLAWSPNGREVWYSGAPTGANRELRAVTLSGRERVLGRVMGSTRLEDVASTGRLLIAHELLRQRVFVYTPGTGREQEMTWLDVTVPRGLSADGTRVLLVESGEGGGPGYSVFVRTTDGAPAVRLGDGDAMALSRDGLWALALRRSSTGDALIVYPTGVGESHTIPVPGLNVQRASWLPGRDRILVSAGEKGHGVRLYLMEAASGHSAPIGPDGYAAVANGVSPDGKQVVVRGPDRSFYLFPLSGGTPVPIPQLSASDYNCGWSEDGRSLYVAGPDGGRRRIDRVDLVTGKRDFWKQLTGGDGAASIGSPTVTPDGQSYVYSYMQPQGDLYEADGVR